MYKPLKLNTLLRSTRPSYECNLDTDDPINGIKSGNAFYHMWPGWLVVVSGRGDSDRDGVVVSKGEPRYWTIGLHAARETFRVQYTELETE